MTPYTSVWRKNQTLKIVCIIFFLQTRKTKGLQNFFFRNELQFLFLGVLFGCFFALCMYVY